MWFSAAKPAKDKNPAVVWVLNPSVDDYMDVKDTHTVDDIERTKIVIPRHSNARVRVQAGLFTAHFIGRRARKFTPLERNKNFRSKFNKFVIPSENFSAIRSDLDRCGINSGTMFPDLSGLAAHVEWKHTNLEDEGL